MRHSSTSESSTPETVTLAVPSIAPHSAVVQTPAVDEPKPAACATGEELLVAIMFSLGVLLPVIRRCVASTEETFEKGF